VLKCSKYLIFIPLLAGFASAQQPASPVSAPPALAPMPETVLRATTRLIQVNVIVHDKQGQPVRDLKKEDFVLLDTGKPQQIAFFSMDSNAVLPQSAKLAPNVFTNQLQQKSAVPSSVTVILIDELNTKIQDQQYARQQVIRYLKTIHPEDRVAIYALGSSLRVLHDFTTDSSDLLRRLEKYTGSVLPETTAADASSFQGDSGALQLDQWMRGAGASKQERDFYTINRVDGTLHTLEFIANHLASLPGRKNLIWVSGGFPLQIGFGSVAAMRDPSREQRTFGPEVERTIKALNDGNVAIYPVDARGLVVDTRFSAENRKVDLTPKLSMGPVVEHQQTMSVLADSTGGHAYYNTNDLASAIRSAVDDSALTYTLGFYPGNEANDGKFHKLQVKTPGHNGLNTRYRKGYFDVQEKPLDAKARRIELRDAVWSPMDSSALGLLVQLAPTDPAHPNDLNVYVKIDPRGVGLTMNGGHHDGAIDILFVQKNEQGKQFNGADDTITLALQEPSFQKVEKDGFLYRKLVPRVPQATQLRIVVRDASSGSLGSVTVPFNQLRL
jgi:VWFA-related protein